MCASGASVFIKDLSQMWTNGCFPSNDEYVSIFTIIIICFRRFSGLYNGPTIFRMISRPVCKPFCRNVRHKFVVSG